jgi:hypothetical protein
MPRVRLATWIEASPERVFDLARSIDLHAQGQALHGERAIAGVTQPSHELALARVATRRLTHVPAERGGIRGQHTQLSVPSLGEASVVVSLMPGIFGRLWIH